MQKRKIAIPVADGKLVAIVNQAKQFYIYDTEDYSITKETMEIAPADKADDFSTWLTNFSITEIVAQEMAQAEIDAFLANQTNVILGAPIMPPKDLAMDYLKQVEQMDAQSGGCCGSGGGNGCGCETNAEEKHEHSHDHGGGCGCH